jgi:hypothetical protein
MEAWGIENKEQQGKEIVSLAHLVRQVDVQSSHPGSNLHGHRIGFLLFKKKNHCRGFSYRISFKKKLFLN